MKTVQLTQGTPEWHAHRAQHFNASDAPAMMGCSPYKTRDALLRELATGIAPEVDQATQRRFDDGHRFEALARPLAEAIVGEDLYPVTGTNGRLSASFDGLTLMSDTVFEHKTLNEGLSYTPWDQGNGHHLPLVYRVQMEHQLLVSGAERALFMASKWTEDGELVEERHCWYASDADLRLQILAGWSQFAADLAAYVPPAAAEPAPVGRAPETLPALLVQVSGAVTASNLAEFKAVALGAIRAVNRDLKTDQDFADADKAVKWCADVESRIKAAKEHALAQTASIDELFRALDDITAEARAVRLDLDKLVKRRKEEVKAEAVAAAVADLNKHLAGLAAEVAPARLNLPPADFGGAIKGLKTVASMNNALGVALANAKIAADAQARLLRGNLADFKARAAGYEHLFADVATLAHKTADDFTTLVDARIANHKAAEAAKEAQRQADEARRIAEAEERARQQERDRQAAAEAKRISDEQEARRLSELAEQQRQAAAAAAVAAEARALIISTSALASASASSAAAAFDLAPVAVAVMEEKPIATVALGEICRRFGVTMTAAFVSDTLGVPYRAEKAARLYTESDVQRIGRALIAHITKAISQG